MTVAAHGNAPVWSYKRGKAFGELFLNGALVLRDDFDAAPSSDFIFGLWAWVCAVLNDNYPGKPVLSGAWRYSRGFLCCGTLRVATLPYGLEPSDIEPRMVADLEKAVNKLNAALVAEASSKWFNQAG